ncbi:hypothetical protein [Coxiella-like endosymbiont of Amblyomma americanum]|uniref:hypothetical protein n=1 Tax=Coxiella-like endosymbiont of Amblyomma americanum TaxID=1987500 RepID=UPI0011D0D940|nr:hypothetical protein [Coxiella-like endosymbiont of Amblyomma americanum]
MAFNTWITVVVGLYLNKYLLNRFLKNSAPEKDNDLFSYRKIENVLIGFLLQLTDCYIFPFVGRFPETFKRRCFCVRTEIILCRNRLLSYGLIALGINENQCCF